jgi:predicted  nucleic acid-binding Zn-ribbon protein
VVTPAVKAALQKLSDLQQKAADTAAQRALKEQRVSDISNDQSRIRANMDRLSQGSDLYKRYVKTLSDEEDELAKLRDDIAKLRDAETAQRKAVADFIQTLEVS